MLKVEPEALTAIAAQGMTDIAHLLRPAHLQQLSNILADPEASENDKFVAIIQYGEKCKCCCWYGVTGVPRYWNRNYCWQTWYPMS